MLMLAVGVDDYDLLQCIKILYPFWKKIPHNLDYPNCTQDKYKNA